MAERPVELALNRKDRHHVSLLTDLVDRLLGLVAEFAPEHPFIGVDEFRGSVETWRADLEAERDAWTLERLVPTILGECERFFARARGFENARDGEINETITVLREVLTTLRGESRSFDTGFAQSASTLAGMVAIDDIRELRTALSREVATLKKLVDDRNAREDAAYVTLNKKVDKLEASLKEARDEASKDGLTGVANRRSFDRALARLVARSERGQFPFTLALIDVDDFKTINDQHGHAIGDRVILCVAHILAAHVRANDLVARYGGEEFALLLEQTPAAQARSKLEKLVKDVEKTYSYEYDGEMKLLTFTYSIGAADHQPGDAADDLIKRADEALYNAKRKGKNRVEVTSPTLLKRLLG
jgi:diguanylate cyclase (GGDEF)-like protein